MVTIMRFEIAGCFSVLLFSLVFSVHVFSADLDEGQVDDVASWLEEIKSLPHVIAEGMSIDRVKNALDIAGAERRRLSLQRPNPFLAEYYRMPDGTLIACDYKYLVDESADAKPNNAVPEYFLQRIRLSKIGGADQHSLGGGRSEGPSVLHVAYLLDLTDFSGKSFPYIKLCVMIFLGAAIFGGGWQWGRRSNSQ